MTDRKEFVSNLLYSHTQFVLAPTMYILRSVNMKTFPGAMSTRVKHRAINKRLTGAKNNHSEVHRRLQDVYGADVVDRSAPNRWVVKFHDCKPKKAKIVDKTQREGLITSNDHESRKIVDDHVGISKEHIIIQQICVQ